MLAKEQRDVLIARAARRNVKAGTLVVRCGAATDELYVVISGKLKTGVTLAAGHDKTVDVFGPNEVFGEISLFAGGTRTADIEAVEDCELLVLRRPEVLLAMRQEPEIATALLQVMAEHIVSLSETIERAASPGRPAHGSREE